jgi:hypothetical protein
MTDESHVPKPTPKAKAANDPNADFLAALFIESLYALNSVVPAIACIKGMLLLLRLCLSNGIPAERMKERRRPL